MDNLNMKIKTNDNCMEEPAMAYVPWQYFSTPYEPQKALMVGTIFPELDKPFTGRKERM